MNTLLKKASKKYHARRSVQLHEQKETTYFCECSHSISNFSNCPLVWISHSRIMNNRINKIHEKA